MPYDRLAQTQEMAQANIIGAAESMAKEFTQAYQYAINAESMEEALVRLFADIDHLCEAEGLNSADLMFQGRRVAQSEVNAIRALARRSV